MRVLMDVKKSVPSSSPIQSKVRMPPMVANDQDADTGGLDIVEEMVREALQVGSPESFTRGMKSQRVFSRLGDRGFEFHVELPGETRGNVVVFPGSFQNVPPHERMEFYFHCARARSKSVQNCAAASGATRPESRSSRRRTAS